MRYIVEINSFYDWLTYNEISPNAKLLWHILMQFNNKCPIEYHGQYFWRVQFSVANSRLKNTMGFTSNMQLQRAREELLEAGRIKYETGTTRNAGRYQMIHFDSHTQIRPLGELLRPHGISVAKDLADTLVYCYQVVTNNVTNLLLNPLTLIDIDINSGGVDKYVRTMRTRENNSVDTVDNCLDMYLGMNAERKAKIIDMTKALVTGVWGRRIVPEDIRSVCDRVWYKQTDDNDKAALLKYAFEQAAKSGITTWRYVDGVLGNLSARGIKTYIGCDEYDAQRDFDNDKERGFMP